MARRAPARRAMSFLELAAVVAIVGLLTVDGDFHLWQLDAQQRRGRGFCPQSWRSPWFTLVGQPLPRATTTICNSHRRPPMPRALPSTVAPAVATSRSTPPAPYRKDVTLSASHAVLEFDFDGAALAGYSIDIAGEQRSWNISVVTLTGTSHCQRNHAVAGVSYLFLGIVHAAFSPQPRSDRSPESLRSGLDRGYAGRPSTIRLKFVTRLHHNPKKRASRCSRW